MAPRPVPPPRRPAVSEPASAGLDSLAQTLAIDEVPVMRAAPTPPAALAASAGRAAAARTADPEASSQLHVVALRELADGSEQEEDIEPDPYVGTMIGERYLVDGVLGEGGMGRVYLAHHKIIDKKVAIKILHADLAKDKEAVGRFMREARSASSIGNPHIVDILDFGEAPDGATYFVMEFLDGKTLAYLMESRGRLPVEMVCDVIDQMCDGLAAAHAQQIVHRDLKPDNVTILSRGAQKTFVKILDFGIAKVSTATSATKLTMAGAVFGTPHYMSPEQAAGAAVDHRTDVYSLGVMMYEMLSGETPFNADNFMGILTQHMYKAPVPLRALVSCPDTPAGLEAIVLKCLSKKSDGRYQSMEEVAEDVKIFRAGGIPKAVHEMMARSGNFNVPADYFKSAQAAVLPATPPAGPRRRASTMLWASLVVVGVAVAAFFVLRQSLGTNAQEASAAAPMPSAAPSPPASPATSSGAPVPTRDVAVAAEPSDGAYAIVAGERRDLPTVVRVPEGQSVSVEVGRDGFEPQTITLDGAAASKLVKLTKLASASSSASAKAPTVRSTATVPVPTIKKTTTKPPSTNKDGVVNPWGQGG